MKTSQGNSLERQIVKRWGRNAPTIVQRVGTYLNEKGRLGYFVEPELASFEWTRAVDADLRAVVTLRPGSGLPGFIHIATSLSVRSPYLTAVWNYIRPWECQVKTSRELLQSNLDMPVLGVLQEWLAWNANPSALMPLLYWNDDNTDEIERRWVWEFEQYTEPFFQSAENIQKLAHFLVSLPSYPVHVKGNSPHSWDPLFYASAFLHKLGQADLAITTIESAHSNFVKSNSNSLAIQEHRCKVDRFIDFYAANPAWSAAI